MSGWAHGRGVAEEQKGLTVVFCQVGWIGDAVMRIDRLLGPLAGRLFLVGLLDRLVRLVGRVRLRHVGRVVRRARILVVAGRVLFRRVLLVLRLVVLLGRVVLLLLVGGRVLLRRVLLVLRRGLLVLDGGSSPQLEPDRSVLAGVDGAGIMPRKSSCIQRGKSRVGLKASASSGAS